MVEIEDLRYGDVIKDVHGNLKRVVDIGDDVTDNEGRELLTTDSAGRSAIRANNITGRGMAIIRQDMLYTYDFVSHDDEWFDG